MYFIEVDDSQVDCYLLYRDDCLLGSFFRKTLREDLQHIADSHSESSNWMGAILRIFYRLYPHEKYRPDLFSCDAHVRDTSLSQYSVQFLVSYLRDKGYRVYRSIDFSDDDVVQYLSDRGYTVDRFELSNILYCSN